MAKTPPDDLNPATRLVTGGRRAEWTGTPGRPAAIVNPPIWRASTHLYDDVAALKAGPRHNADGHFFYGRRGSPTQWALAEALTALEPEAEGTVLYPSGVSAIHGALTAVLKPGDVLLMTDNAYDPSRSMAMGLLKDWGIETRFFDPRIGSGIADLICDRTAAIWMENPGSLTFEVTDVPAITAIARARGIVTLLDNTWATPLFYSAMAHGVDISVIACTKYVVGHSDVMLGSATANAAHYGRIRDTAQRLGIVVSPDDAWLALRGLRTMDVRLQRHQTSALTLAKWLATRPEVARVLHPALPDAPGHAIWQRDFTGSSGLFSFVLKGGDAAARARFIDALHLFGIGYSWGGFESLAIPADPAPYRSATSWPLPDMDKADHLGIRLQIGLEHVDDLRADLERGFSALLVG